MNSKKAQLLASAAKLARLGKDVDAARRRLRRLVERGVSYDSEEMRTAYNTFMALETQWKELE